MKNLAPVERGDPTEGLLDDHHRLVARAVPAPAGQRLNADERHERHVRRLVTQVLAHGVEEERRTPGDGYGPRQEPVREPAARIDRRHVPPRVHGGREGVHAVVRGQSVVTRGIAGAVSARVRVAEVDVAHERQRRCGRLAGGHDEPFDLGLVLGLDVRRLGVGRRARVRVVRRRFEHGVGGRGGGGGRRGRGGGGRGRGGGRWSRGLGARDTACAERDRETDAGRQQTATGSRRGRPQRPIPLPP